MIEAMSQGAIPIQSNTSCGEEWIRIGQDGYLVAHDDWQSVAGNLMHILQDDDFALAAQARNLDAISEKYDSAQLSKIAVGYYEKLLG
jgi:glycosyltransferase involved in cell wall biosynthesis